MFARKDSLEMYSLYLLVNFRPDFTSQETTSIFPLYFFSPCDNTLIVISLSFRYMELIFLNSYASLRLQSFLYHCLLCNKLLIREPFWRCVISCFTFYYISFQAVTDDIYWYYLIELGFYMSYLYMLFTDHKRKVCIVAGA